MKFQKVDVREDLLLALWKRKFLHFNNDFQSSSHGIQVPDS